MSRRRDAIAFETGAARLVEECRVSIRRAARELGMVARLRGPALTVVHRSDWGAHRNSEQCQRLLTSLGITCRASRRGDVWNSFDYAKRFSPARQHAMMGNVRPLTLNGVRPSRVPLSSNLGAASP